jgi:hypothetical protein
MIRHHLALVIALAAPTLSGCAVLAVGGAAVGVVATGVGVATTVGGAAVNATGAVVGAGARALTPSEKPKESQSRDQAAPAPEPLDE